jgi:MarR family transcriptional regulator, transcriptional regulator for hemolysin
MPRPTSEPIGLQTSRTAKVLSRAFDDALATAGGSLPVWLVLVALKGRQFDAQRELAEAVGIEGPTLTHHLNRMEAAGLVTRTRDPENRRLHRVALTPDGHALFDRLRRAAGDFDRRLRRGMTDAEVVVLRGLLERLHDNATTTTSAPTSAAEPARVTR